MGKKEKKEEDPDAVEWVDKLEPEERLRALDSYISHMENAGFQHSMNSYYELLKRKREKTRDEIKMGRR